MAEQGPPKPTPIYVSYLTFTNLLDWLRELGTLPSQFDRTFWGQKFSGSGGGQLMAGLRWLGLLDADKPEPRLETLALATPEERKPLLVELIRDAYGAEFIDGLPRHTLKIVNEHLAALGTAQATHDKARSFFVNAAKAVDLQMQPSVAKQARNRPSVTRKPSAKKAKSDKAEDLSGSTPPHPDPDRPKQTKNDDEGIRIAPLLKTLLIDLEKIAPTWSKPERDSWKRMWDSALDYSHPAKEDKSTSGSEV